MIHIDYQKRKNQELFKSLEEHTSLFLSNTQNYIPIYKRFLSLNETNYNGVNLNHRWYLSSVKNSIDDCPNLFECKIKNIQTQKVKDKEVFFKMAPLLVPYKYLNGKYAAETENILNSANLSQLQKGAYLINVARGDHLVEEDLLALLASGHLSGATLDVFRVEPLPKEHPFWGHPDITITPHASARTLRDESILQIAKKIMALDQGCPIEGLVDPVTGY